MAAGYAAEVMGEWFYEQLLQRVEKGYSHSTIQRMGQRLFYTISKTLAQWGIKHHKKLETGVLMLLCVRNYYYIFRLGESNVYFVKKRIMQRFKKGSPLHTLGNQRKHKPDYERGSLRGMKGILLCEDSVYAYMQPQWIETGIEKNIRLWDEESLQKTIEEIGNRVMGKMRKVNQEIFPLASIIYIKPNVLRREELERKSFAREISDY